MMLDV